MKIFTYKARKGKWHLKAFLDSGGMPSSHSSLCTGVTTAVAMVHGITSSLFAVCVCFSLIVMYDAAGVRRHAGKQAEVLNMIIEDLWEGQPVSERQLKAALEERGPSLASHAASDNRLVTLAALSGREEGGASGDGTQASKERQPGKQARTAEVGGTGDTEYRRYKLMRLEQVNAIRTRNGEAKLKEVLGHTPVQVVCGAALGILIALCIRPL